jgi:hypothetical protein
LRTVVREDAVEMNIIEAWGEGKDEEWLSRLLAMQNTPRLSFDPHFTRLSGDLSRT